MNRCAHISATVLAMVAALATAPQARSDIALELLPGAPDAIFPAGGTTHGWQFSVNQVLRVTHLGLYDMSNNGFFEDHPIGLWDEEGALLAQDVMSTGVGDQLIDHFRYVDITDNENANGKGVILTPGMQYTIGFYAFTANPNEGMVIFDGFHFFDENVDYVGVGVANFTNGLEMPDDPDQFGSHFWGPNFQFEVVPGPGALCLLALGALGSTRRRSRICAIRSASA